MAITIRSQVTLDNVWVDAILLTGFDGQYGACWYWLLNEVGPVPKRHYTYIADPNPQVTYSDGEPAELLVAIKFSGWILEEWPTVRPEVIKEPDEGDRWKDSTLVVDLDALQYACNKVLGDEHLQRTDTGQQLLKAVQYAVHYPDEAPDLDAEAADVLIQIALFGEIVFG